MGARGTKGTMDYNQDGKINWLINKKEKISNNEKILPLTMIFSVVLGFSSSKLKLYIYLSVCMCEHMWESVLFFHHVRAGDELRLSGHQD